jgi:outer membrane protein OmpA-like peptidoglycan-associated protein
VKDAKTGAILDGVKVTVTGNFGKSYETAGQNSINDPVNGPIGDSSKPEIVVTYMKEGYQPKMLRIKEWPADQRVLDISEALVKEDPASPESVTRLLTGKYTDAKTGEELDGVSVKVSGGVAGGYMAARAGIHEMVTPGKGEIVVNVSKPGYKSKTLTFAEWPTAQQVQDISAKLEREEELAQRLRKEFIIYFDFDKYYIRKPDAWGTLEECLAYVTKEYPSSNLSLTGHTDSRAPLSYNVTLSRNRVETTKKWLAARGVDSSRMSTGYDGEVKPAVPCPDPNRDPDTCLNEKQHQLNRRVVIVVEY